MAIDWDDDSPLDPAKIAELIERTGLTQEKFAAMVEMSQPHVSKLKRGAAPVLEGPTRVLLRWLFAVYGIEGGRAPHPGIPVKQVQLRAAD